MSVRLQSSLEKILKENVSSGDFLLSNFKQKLEFFLDFILDKIHSFKELSPNVLSGTVKKLVASLTPAGLCPNGRIPVPSPKRIWVSTFYARYMLDKAFVSQDDIELWVHNTWPALQVTETDINEAWLIIANYSQQGQSKPRLVGQTAELQVSNPV